MTSLSVLFIWIYSYYFNVCFCLLPVSLAHVKKNLLLSLWLLLICSSLSGQSQGKNESGGQSVPRPKPPSDPTIRNLELRKDTSAVSLAKLYFDNQTDSKSGE